MHSLSLVLLPGTPEDVETWLDGELGGYDSFVESAEAAQDAAAKAEVFDDGRKGTEPSKGFGRRSTGNKLIASRGRVDLSRWGGG